MKLGDYVRTELTAVGLEGHGAEELLERLVALPAGAGLLSDPDAVLRSLVDRERAHTTALGSGVAVPHALCVGLDHALVVVGISTRGVAFTLHGDEPPADRAGSSPPGTETVHIVFLLLSPPGGSADHIKLLARIARLVRDERFRSALRSGRSPEEVVDVIRAFEREHI